jgi:hypothetical protein
MTQSVELARIGFPFADPPDSPPHIATAEYERRLDALWDATDVDWIAVYGDPEHRGNLSYLCGVDPRFEEALLVLGRDSRRLIVGTEGRELAHQGPVPIETLWVPTLSGAGIDRGSGMTLREAIAATGVERGHRVGVIGWKLLEPLEWTEQVPGIAAPAFVVDALRLAAGGADHVLDLTATLLDARDGQRFANGADQIAFFEWGASHAAAAVHGVIASSRPGGSEAELATGMRYSGAPLSYHPVVASGPDLPAVLGRPGSRVVGLGEPVFVMVGVWGGNCARAGILGADEGDCGPDNPGYLARIAIPYWRTVAAWYEAMAVGRSAGDVFAEVTEACRRQGFRPALGIGHLSIGKTGRTRRSGTDPTPRSAVARSSTATSSRTRTGRRTWSTARTRSRSPTARCGQRSRSGTRSSGAASSAGSGSCASSLASASPRTSCRSRIRPAICRRSGSMPTWPSVRGPGETGGPDPGHGGTPARAT